MGVDYIAWVKGKTFKVGDILVFVYGSEEHTVTEVGKTDYYACAGGAAQSSDNSGATNVTLTAPGTRYFICDIPGHCTAGMRVAVAVAATDDDGSSPPGATPASGSSAAAARPAIWASVAAAAAAVAGVVSL